MKKTLVIMAILLVGVFLLSACGGKTTTAVTSSVPPQTTTAATTTAASPTATTKTPKSGGVFRFADPRGPSTTLGWFAEAGAQAGMWTQAAIETLMEVDMNNVLHPNLATEWKVSDDLTTVTLTLRKGVKFHDGSEFNAAVVKWNIDQMIAAKVAVNYSYMTAVEAVDDSTVKITLSKYNNTILNTLGNVYILSKNAFDTQGKEWMRWNPIGTGPFKFVSFSRDVNIKYTRNPDYWRPGMPYLAGIEMYFVPDATTMVTAYLAGDYDAIGGDLLNTFIGQLSGSTFVRGYSGSYTLAPDSKNADSPWSNLKVRQALEYAIDKAAIAKARGFGFWTPVNNFANPDTTSYNKNIVDRAYNPATAKQLLAEAGYPNGFSTKLLADTSSSDRDAITAVQAMMEAVGIKTELNLVDFASYGNYRTKGWNNAVLAGMAGFFANHNQITDFYWSQTATFYPSILKSDELQKLHMESLNNKTYDPTLYHKVSRYLTENALVFPLWSSARMSATKSFVKDPDFYQLSAWPQWRPYQIWLDK